MLRHKPGANAFPSETQEFVPSPSAVAYAWRQLALRMGLDELPITADYGLAGQGPLPRIVVVPCRQGAVSELLNATAGSLHRLPAAAVMPGEEPLPVGDDLPVLLWGEGHEHGRSPFATRRDDGTVVVYADVIAATLFMLSRWEEHVGDARDEHGRFPYTASVSHIHGFLDRPLVDEYALVLKAWLQALVPDLDLPGTHFAVRPTHDIDAVARFRTAPRGLRTLGADVIKRRSWRLARRTTAQLWTQLARPGTSAELDAVRALARTAEDAGLRSAFYFMTARRGRLDNGYDISAPPVASTLADLRLAGHEIGIHPGYETLDDPELFATQKARLDAVLGDGIRYGGRQHYLRFRVPDTWRTWERLGLTHDSTMGFAGREGFRCGTCHPYRPYDIAADRELDLVEIPLIVMDRTLRKYRGLTVDEGEERLLDLAGTCRRVGGTFTLLWHNTLASEDDARWLAMYRDLLPQLAAVAAQS